MGLSMRDGKPMGVIEAPLEATGCCNKNFGSLGDNRCVRNSTKYSSTVNNINYVCRNVSHVFPPTSFICVPRLLTHDIKKCAYKT